MRTTITLDDDVAAAVERLRTDECLGRSEAVDRLARRGMRTAPEDPTPYEPYAFPIGLQIDVTGVGAALEILDAVPDAARSDELDRLRGRRA